MRAVRSWCSRLACGARDRLERWRGRRVAAWLMRRGDVPADLLRDPAWRGRAAWALIDVRNRAQRLIDELTRRS